MARFCRVEGAYHLHIALGEVYLPKNLDERLKECGFPHCPHSFIKLKGDIQKFIENQRSEYISMCYGNFKKELVHLCYLLDIKPLLTA